MREQRFATAATTAAAVAAMVLAGAVSWLGPSAHAGSPEASGEALGALVPSLMSRYSTPGVALALIDHGKIVFESGFGTGGSSAITAHTAFGAGSVSKAVTAFGIMTLAQSKRIRLDDPANGYMRRWHFPRTRGWASKVTVRQLGSHMAGASVDGYNGSENEARLPSLVDSLSGKTGYPVRLLRAPGTHFTYSSGGYAVLQLIIEDVTHRPFADYMHDAVLSPLGMHDSSFTLTQSERSILAQPHHSRGKPRAVHVFTEQGPDGLFASAHDLAQFLIAETGRSAVLSPASVAELIGPQPGTLHADPFATASSYGLGIYRERVRAGRDSVWHPGVVPGYAMMAAAASDGSSGIVVMTNADPGIHLAATMVCEWSRRFAGKELHFCTSATRLQRTAIVVTQSSAAGLIVAGIVMLTGLITRRRRRRVGRRRLAWGTLSGAPVAMLGGAWWLFWFTNTLTAGIWHEDIVPAALVPAPLRMWSYLLIALCGVLAIVMMTTEPTDRPAKLRRSSAAWIVPALAWIVIWHTDWVTRPLLGTPGVVPAAELPEFARLRPASIAVAFGAIAVARTRVLARRIKMDARAKTAETAAPITPASATL
ncbi:MAG: hypothetical protein NVSMB57_05210 [Actinomycetota bacterium]